jgi:DNA-binding MarR family transcriptional regulator
MTSHEAGLEEWQHLSHVVIAVAEETKEAFANAVFPLGLSAPAARALLGIISPTPMRVLAELLACDPSYLTGVADQLETAGLVVRTAGGDRRVKLLELTASGTEMRARIAEAVNATERFSSRLTPRERTQLAGFLEKLLDSNTAS